MKAISLHQPWASAIALGAKHVETRHWDTPYRGRIAIHAAKRKVLSELELLEQMTPFRAAFWDPANKFMPFATELPYGALVATAVLASIKPTHLVDTLARYELKARQGAPGGLCWCEDQMGDFSPGRFAWMLEDIQPFPDPIPYRGAQGFFNVPDEVLGL